MKVRFLWLAFVILFFARYAAASAFTTPPPANAAPGSSFTVAGNASVVNPPGQSYSLLILWWRTPDGTWHDSAFGSGSVGTMSGTYNVTFSAQTGSTTGTWTIVVGAVMGAQPAQGTSPTGSTASATTVVGIPITAATINSLTYNGAAQSPGSLSSVTPAGATVTVSAPAQTNAGTYATATVTGTGNYYGTLSNVSWTINKANQGTVSISPTSTLVNTGGSAAFTGSGGSTGSYVWGGTSGATGSGSSLNVGFGTAGSYTVTVQDAGNGNFNASNVATSTVTVDTLPSLSGSYSPNAINFGQSSTVSISATQNSAPLSGLVAMYYVGGSQVWATIPGVTYSLTNWPATYPNDTNFIYSSLSFSSDAASGSAATKTFVVTPKTAGTFWQFGIWGWDTSSNNGSYNTIATTLTVNKTTPTGAYANASKAPQSGTLYTASAGDFNASFSNPYSGSVAGPTGSISYAVAPTSPGGVAGTAVGVGTNFSAGVTYIIRATYAGDGNYNTAVADSTWTINRIPITAATIAALTYTGSAQSPSAASSTTPAGATVTVSAPAQTNAAVYNTATVTGTGAYSGTLNNVSWSISQATQAAVSITSGTSSTYGNSYAATATGGSGTGAIVWALSTGSTASGAAINSSTGQVTANSTGTVVIKAQRAGDTNYPPSAWTSNFTITFGSRPITVTLSGSKTWNGNTTPTGASASITSGSLASGDTVGYAYASTSSANAGTYTGLTTATISNAGAPTTRTSSYTISYTGSYTINALSQTVTFTPVGNQTVGTPLQLVATASSGLPVTFAVNSGPASITSGQANFSAAGTVTITATQSGNSQYAPASQARTFQVYTTSADPGLKVLTPN
jgi:hypothetical protein